MSAAESELSKLREELARVGRELAEEGLTPGSSGNVSCRAGHGMLITPTGAQLSRLQGHSIPLVDLQGEVVDGELEPSSELALHLAMYEHQDAAAVIHTHAPMATALSAVLDELPCVHYAMVDLGGTVPVAPYRTFGTRALAEAVQEAIGGHTAVLMANHGTLTFGGDLATAAARTRLLEWACTVYWHAATVAAPRTLSSDEQREVVAQLARRS